MIPNKQFLECLQQKGIRFFTGVPDSLLKHICACITDLLEPDAHVIAANEGGAVALAAGHHLATGQIPLVYMQNSGLGNSVNPLLSLADPEVYSIPMLVMIGWRGEPGVHDEPQHVKQGRVQSKLLEGMEMPWAAIGPETNDWPDVINGLLQQAKNGSRPVVLVVKKGTFEDYAATKKTPPDEHLMTREEALGILVGSLDDHDVVVSTTGMPSREIFEIRAGRHSGHHRDFLTVGSMGHCSQIALGMAMKCKSRNVYCVDGDGALIMHMGALAIIGNCGGSNFRHVVVNNGAHDSVGGQPTVGLNMDIPAIARACGYRESRCVSGINELEDAVRWLRETRGPALLEVKVKKGARKNLGRPTRTPIENKQDLMNNLSMEQTIG